MPTIIFLAIAYQIQNKNWRNFFLALGILNLGFNIYNQVWIKEIYSAITLLLLFTLNNYFITWWRKRNDRNNPTSFLQFCADIYLVAKHNKFILLAWIMGLLICIAGICFYTGFTGEAFLGWLLGIYIVLYILKKLFYSVLPPEWFLHDINTGYVFMSVLISWGASAFVYPKLGTHFLVPMVITAILCITGIYWLHKNNRFLIPGCSVVLGDIIWQIGRITQDNIQYTSQFLMTEIVLIIAMLIGLVWLLRKPGIIPILYLALFQLFRFSAFTYQALNRLSVETLSIDETTYYILYLVCWMYIAPLIFWFSGLIHQKDRPLV